MLKSEIISQTLPSDWKNGRKMAKNTQELMVEHVENIEGKMIDNQIILWKLYNF